MAADPRVANGTPDAASVARSLPDSFLRWQIESRRAVLTAIAAGHMPRRFAAHLPVMVTFDAESPFAIRTATKGAGLTPRDEVLDRYIATLEEALARCADRPWEETLAQRVAAVRALLDRPEDVDPRRLAFLEIFRGRSYANLRRDGRVVLHYAGEGPEYSSFQINGRAEVLGPDDRRYRYCALVRRMFEAAPFHLPQPGYVAAYLVWVHEVLDKTPYVVAAPSSERFVPQVEPVASAARPAEVTFREVLVPVDNSSYSRWAAELALQIAGAFGSTVVSSHVYAARLHDRRFRDMEPGLPEEYQQPQVLAHQRAAHDTLIAQGLKLVSDSYLAMLEERCALARLRFVGKPSEGKNYAELVREVEIGGYDLVVMGVRGMGETWRRGRRQHQVIGSVCERVVRRVRRDVLVAKGDRPLGGVFVVGIDGSDRSFAALRIALALARAAGARVQAVAAYDPFLHRALFHELENVLTAEARKVFNTAQQRKLHEELIDSGIAKIYDDHLATAQRIAAEDGMELETTLLAGKPYATLLRHVEKVQPSLLAVGRTGVHADEGLDIGSNAENLLRLAPCHVLLVARSFAPTWAETSTIVVEHLPWTPEALARLERVPAFVRGMARRAVEDYARERGLAAVDEQTVQQARERFGA